MFLSEKKYSLDSVVRLLLGALLFGTALWLLNYLSDVLIPFTVAFLLAYIINPMVVAVQQKIHHRGAALFVTLFGITIILGFVAVLIVPLLLQEFKDSMTLISKLVHDSTMTKKAVAFIPNDIWLTIKEPFITHDFSPLLKNQEYLKGTQELLQKILPGALGIMAGTAQLLFAVVGLFIVLLYLVFLLKDFQKSKEEWQSLIPNRYRTSFLAFLSEADAAMSTYFRAQSHVAALVGILFALGFWAIGLPMGILLGLGIGLLNMVPYLQLIAIIPALFLGFVGALETGSNPMVMLLLIVMVFTVVQVLQDAVITPKIMGTVTGLSPAMILLSISIWGKLLGVFGLIIAIPATCLILAWYKRLQVRTLE